MNGTRRQPIVRMKDIHVSYGAVHALRGVDFDLYPGEIHALAGEHRAGKSSLVRLLSGAVRKNHGVIWIKGKKYESLTPAAAINRGIGIVYQNSNIIETLNSVENIFTGNPLRSPIFFLNKKEMTRKTQEIFRNLKLDIDITAPLSLLTEGQKHMVEVAKILIADPDIIILDEISSKLTPTEMKTVYRIMQEHKADSKSVIYISHDIDEILRLADRVTILKNGYRRGTEYIQDLDKYRLFQLTYSFVLDKEEAKKENIQYHLFKRYIENIVHHIPIGAVLLNQDGRPDVYNLPAMKMLCLEDGSVPSTSEDLVHCFVKPVQKEMLQYITSKQEHTWEEVHTLNERTLRIDAFPFHDDEYVFRGTVLFLQDVSLDRYMSDYILESEKMASIAEVAVGVAHEINNPLYIVQNYLELIKKGESRGEEDFEKIEKELGRIVEIIGSLLSFSRSKKIPGRTVNLSSLLKEVILLLSHVIGEKSINLIQDLSPDSLEIPGDENKLKQLFLNLLMNSMEAVLDGGKIAVLMNKNTDYAEISVTDNGYGIPQEVQDRIFNPFFSTKINKKNTGLGLSICRQIVKEHDGILSFKSSPGRETRFTVRLPL